MSGVAAAGTNGTAGDETKGKAGEGIEVSLLEKRLEGLRDTQESVQGLSLWCQANKKHSTPIIDTWLKVLRRSPVEKRLTMFYLANDVVQHARRKGDSTVLNQWAVAVQKATPHVRTPSSVSAAIIRIFKIWEERNVYSKDTVADLVALISKHNVPGKDKLVEVKTKPEIYTASDEKVKGFQSSSLISKVKLAYRLKSHLGVTFRTKHYVNMNMEQLIQSIKDRQHGMSVVEDMSSLLEQCRASENKLQHEVDERRRIVEAAEVAIVYYENVRSEARIVNSAYKNFTERVVKTKEKVDDMMRAFNDMEGIPNLPTAPIPYYDVDDDDDVQILLPPLSEASKFIEVVQSSKAAAKREAAVSNTTYESQQQLTSQANTTAPHYTQEGSDSSGNNLTQTGTLGGGGGYDIMNWSSESYNSMLSSLMQLQQQNNYALPTAVQIQLLQQQQQQQQVTAPIHSYGYNQGTDGAGMSQPPPFSSDIGSIPLPPPTSGGTNPPPPPLPQNSGHDGIPPPLPSSTNHTSALPPQPYDPAAQSQYDPSSVSQYDPSAQSRYDASSQSQYDPSSQPQYDPPSSQPQYDPPSSQPQYDPPSSQPQYDPASSQPQYDPPSAQSQIPSLLSHDYSESGYGSQPYEPMSVSYDPGPSSNNISVGQPEPQYSQPESQYSPPSERYHPYNNSTPQRDRRFSGGEGGYSPRPRGQGPRNTRPLRSPGGYGGPTFPRTPTSPSTPTRGGPRFSSYRPHPAANMGNSFSSPEPPKTPHSTVAANLLRIAGGMGLPREQPTSPNFGFNSNSNPFEERLGPEDQNGTGDPEEYEMYSNQQQHYEKPFPGRGGGGIRPRGMMTPGHNGPRMPMRGRGGRGGFNSGGFRGGRGMRGGGPRRGGW